MRRKRWAAVGSTGTVVLAIMLNSVTVLARQEVPEEPAPAQASEATAVAIYQVEGGKIVNVWFVR